MTVESDLASSRQLRDELVRLKEVLEKSAALVESLGALVESVGDIDRHISLILPAQPANQRQPHANEAQKWIENANELARNWDIETVIVGLRTLIADLIPIYRDTWVGKAMATDGLVDDARAVLDAYKEYRDNFSNRATYILMREAESLDSRYSYLRHITESLLSEVGSPGPVDPDHAVLELHLPVSTEVSEVLQTLILLNELYDRTAAVIAPGEEPLPLELRHLEAGTMWYLAVGWRLVIPLLREFFRTALQTLTRRGRAETVDAEIAVAIRMGDYAELIEQIGGDPGPIIQRIEDAAPVLGERFSQLFHGRRGRVSLDGEQFNLGPRDQPVRQLPRPPRALPPPARDYRRGPRGTVWHFCPLCSNWPVEDFESMDDLPPRESVCQECRSKERRGACR